MKGPGGGGWGWQAVQQALAAEAAAAVRLGVGLAWRRGHAKVTPLHVATPLLRRDEELELSCFMAALDRLPAAGTVRTAPAASNALVAAVKRAKAMSMGAKVGLHQLAISILDDPVVCRAMRQAGLSPTTAAAALALGAHNESGAKQPMRGAKPFTLSSGSGSQALFIGGSDANHSQPDTLPAPPTCAYGATLQQNSPAAAALLRSKPQQQLPIYEQHGHPILAAKPCYDDQPTHKARPNHNRLENNEKRNFTEVTAENFKVLCNALGSCGLRRKDMAPGIAITVLQCRSGMVRMRRPHATWLLLHGRDSGSKKAVAKGLASLVFGSSSQYSFIPAAELGFLHSFYEAVCENPHRVIMVEDIGHMDYNAQISIKNAITSGRMRGGSHSDGAEASLEDAIIVLSCEKVVPCSRLDLNTFPDDAGMEEEATSFNDAAGIVNVVDGVFFF